MPTSTSRFPLPFDLQKRAVEPMLFVGKTDWLAPAAATVFDELGKLVWKGSSDSTETEADEQNGRRVLHCHEGAALRCEVWSRIGGVLERGWKVCLNK